MLLREAVVAADLLSSCLIVCLCRRCEKRSGSMMEGREGRAEKMTASQTHRFAACQPISRLSSSDGTQC